MVGRKWSVIGLTSTLPGVAWGERGFADEVYKPTTKKENYGMSAFGRWIGGWRYRRYRRYRRYNVVLRKVSGGTGARGCLKI